MAAKKKELKGSELGEAAYAAFCNKLQKIDNKELPIWMFLPAQVRLAWMNAGLAIWRLVTKCQEK